MGHYYTDERNAQIVIALMKAHGIRKVIASPGTTNICLIASIQNDPFFEIYSSPEERSAAYIACGMAAESCEPVAISCTGATASRNYLPALTEAYYRKLPILAITSSRKSYRIGHNFDQVTDRTLLPRDVAKISVQMPLVYDHESEWACVIAANKAMLELKHHGCGPVHINLETNYSRVYDVKEILPVRAIYRYQINESFPEIKHDKIGIFVGAHLKWDDKLTQAVEKFCEKYNAVVLHDHISNYTGRYGILANLDAIQKKHIAIFRNLDLLIHLGDITGGGYFLKVKEVWRVNLDGELRDTYGKLTKVFECEEQDFFEKYNEMNTENKNISFFKECDKDVNNVKSNQLDLPFSNAWVASQTAHKLPKNSVLHLGIQNSLRFWNFFDTTPNVLCYSNTGGFGIDGSISSAVGASLASPNKLIFCVLGDLAFFYDLNSLGNRHIKNNLRILLINNGRGTEFKLSGNPGAMFGSETDRFIAAAGHYGNKSHDLVKHFAEDLGFKYLCAKNKEEYLTYLDYFVNPLYRERSIIYEVFTDSLDEDKALTLISEAECNNLIAVRQNAKELVKGFLGEKGIARVKKVLER